MISAEWKLVLACDIHAVFQPVFNLKCTACLLGKYIRKLQVHSSYSDHICITYSDFNFNRIRANNIRETEYKYITSRNASDGCAVGRRPWIDSDNANILRIYFQKQTQSAVQRKNLHLHSVYSILHHVCVFYYKHSLAFLFSSPSSGTLIKMCKQILSVQSKSMAVIRLSLCLKLMDICCQFCSIYTFPQVIEVKGFQYNRSFFTCP